MIVADVSPAIAPLARAATLTTRADGTYDEGGNAVPGASTDTTIQAAVLAISPSELRLLPEGIRDEAIRVCWTVSTVNLDDRITQDSVTYRVIHTADRKTGNYTRSILGAVA